jgi:hypothetical protein
MPDEAIVAIEANKSEANKAVAADVVVTDNVAKDAIDTNETIGTGAASNAILVDEVIVVDVANKVDTAH